MADAIAVDGFLGAPPRDQGRQLEAIDPRVPPERRGLRLLRDVRREPLDYFTRLAETEGPFAWARLQGQLLLMLNDATGIQHVQQDNAENYRKTKFYNVLQPLLGEGIFLSDGPLWLRQRREAAPVFANKNFGDMSEQMVAAVEAMFERWEPRIARGETFDIPLEMMALTLDVLLRALFHESGSDMAARMQSALDLVLGEAEARIWAPISLPQRWVLAQRKYRDALQFIDKIVRGLIDARRRDAAYPEDLLSRLLESYGDSPKEQTLLRDQAMAFLLAGHETTAHSLTWALYSLGLHTHARQKLVAEADEVLGTRPPTFADVRSLTYARQVFDEALRLYPPVWTMSREAIGDDIIPLDDGRCLRLPANSAVMMCSFAVHRRSAYWDHPSAFEPERFAGDAAATRPKFSWFPFGGGPRLCLGFRFAQIEAAIVLASIAQRYELTLLPGQKVEPKPSISLRASGPMRFRIERRSAVRTRPEQRDRPRADVAGCPFH